MSTADDVYGAIVKYKMRHCGNSPTVRELAALTNLSVTAVCYRMRQLKADGSINFEDGQPRNITVPGYAWVSLPKITRADVLSVNDIPVSEALEIIKRVPRIK